MTAINIFQTIRETTHRIEPFHSQFLGDALRASLKGDRSLFDGVWNLCTPADWAPPENAEVANEFPLEGAQRIDILVRDEETGRILGIEVKTSRASARSGQLEGYLQGLRNRIRSDNNKIAIAYLTPFNRKHAEPIVGNQKASALSTVQVFEEFYRSFSQARHVSWLDVADIKWNGGEIWTQHQSFVRDRMADPEKLKKSLARNRSFDKFFSAEAVEAFWDALPENDGDDANDGAIIDLTSFQGSPAELVRALTILINDFDCVASNKEKKDRFKEELSRRFLEASPHREFHRAIFNLARRFGHVWVQGERNYGLRVAHKDHSSGVSLLTSQNPDRLLIGQRR